MDPTKVSLSSDADGRLSIMTADASLELPRPFSGGLLGLAHAAILLLRRLDRATDEWAVGSWFIPPGTYLWTLVRQEQTVLISIEWFPGQVLRTLVGKGELAFQAEYGLRRFAVQLKNQLQASLADDADYRFNRRRSMYQKLDDALREEKSARSD